MAAKWPPLGMTVWRRILEAALGERARGNRKLLEEKGQRHGNLYAVVDES